MKDSDMLHDDSRIPILKLLLIWVAAAVSSMTLQHVLMFITIVYTLVQLYVLVRDKIVNHKKDK